MQGLDFIGIFNSVKKDNSFCSEADAGIIMGLNLEVDRIVHF